jgi:hypothetical protein
MNIPLSQTARVASRAEPAWFAAGTTMIFLAAAVALAPPLAMLFRFVSRGYNEGWNAFWADASRSGTLYPSVDSLVSNNYPPISFHLVALVGRLLGDNVIAGRLVSVVSLGFIVLAAFLWLRTTGSARRIALAGAAFVLAAFVSYGDKYIAMNDPQMLAHAFMLGALVILWHFDFSRRAVLAGAALMLLGGFTKHLLIPLPVAVTAWIAIYRREHLGAWLACFAVGVPVGFWLTWSSYPQFIADLLSARVYVLDQGVSATRHALIGFLPLLAMGAVPLVKQLRANPGAALPPRTVMVLMYVVLSLIIGAVASGGEGVTRNAFFDLLIAVSLFAALGLEWLWANSRTPRLLGLSAAPAVMVVLGGLIGLYGISLVPQTVSEVRDADALEQDTRTMVQMIQRLGKGHAACETLALCYWAHGQFTMDFFNYGQKLRTGALPIESCTAALQRGEFPVLQLEVEHRARPGWRLWPCSPAIDQYYTVAYRSRIGMLLVPKQAVAKL